MLVDQEHVHGAVEKAVSYTHLAGKWIIVFNMIVGRVGMVAFVLAFMKQPSKSPLRYPETRLPLS